MEQVNNKSSFNEICSLAICINIKAFDLINRKQLKILKIFLEYLIWDFMLLLTENNSAETCLTNTIPRTSYV